MPNIKTANPVNSFIPLSVPVIQGNEWTYVKECLDTGWVSSAGKYVQKFEETMCSYVGTKQAVACINGTSALHISLLLAGVGAGDEVIVPTVTFIAPVNAVRYVGAQPVFMDCDDYLNMDVQKLKDFFTEECLSRKGMLINKKTKKQIKAIIPVHIFGHPVDMEPLMILAKQYNLFVIEDATESLGSYYRQGKYSGKMTGSIADVGCLSFNGNKIITAGGGGMIVTNNKTWAEKAKYLTTQAKDDEVQYIHHEVGYNYRLTNVASAIGLAQMEKLEAFIATKRTNFELYKNLLSGVPGLSFIEEPAYGFSNYWFYSLVVDKKDFGLSNLELMEDLSKEKIQTRPIWYLNHLQKPYKKQQAYKIQKAKKYFERVLNLPCSVDLAAEDIKRVVESIKSLGNKK
ncbi:MAG: LegC family aminotransferase [Candidatus Omnitrophica bacterium]|nr:LegC family aminotransferase [Candidatus Omnitrophota bacterium]